MTNSVTQSKIIRAKELAERLSISRVTVWRWARSGLLPAKRKLGPHVSGWLDSDIDAWLASKAPAGAEDTKTDERRP